MLPTGNALVKQKRSKYGNNENLLCMHACVSVCMYVSVCICVCLCAYMCVWAHTTKVNLKTTMKHIALFCTLIIENASAACSNSIYPYLCKQGRIALPLPGCRPALVSVVEVVALTTSDSRVMSSVISFNWSSACWTVLLSSTLWL